MKFLTTCIAVCLIMALQVNAQTPGQNQQEIIVKFKVPMSMERVTEFVRQHRLMPQELYYESHNGSGGGYRPSPGQDIEKALESLYVKRVEFLNAAIEATHEALARETDQTLLDGLTELTEQFQSQLDEVLSRNDVEVSALRLNDERMVPTLLRSAVVESITADPKKQSRREEIPQSGDITTQSTSHESWAPYRGTSKVTQGMTFQTFYFNNSSAFGSTSTYEHETQVYDKKFADYNSYWDSNLPGRYYDTPFTDSIDNFTVGSSQASSLKTYTQYYTYMSLKAGSALSATVRIKGQKGYRSPSWCYSTWCIWPQATTSSMATFTAPVNGISWQY